MCWLWGLHAVSQRGVCRNETRCERERPSSSEGKGRGRRRCRCRGGGGEERFGNDAERVACEGAVNTIEALGGLAFPFDNGGSSLLDADSSLENTNIDSRSDGAALTLLHSLAGATLLTILGPKTLGFRSSFTNPFPTVASEAVDRFASATSPDCQWFPGSPPNCA